MAAEVGLFNRQEDRWSLRGMTALVTGGSRGIGFVTKKFCFFHEGSLEVILVNLTYRVVCVFVHFRRAIVEELAGFGVAVHTCARNESELEQCLKEWESRGFKVTGSVCDVKFRDEREKLIKSVSAIFHGKIDILINNAATTIPKEAQDVTSEDIATIMSTNFESAYHLSQLSYPLLKASRNGSIVNISSIGSVLGFPCSSIYAASKGAMEQITKNLACEWAKDNIRVNAIAPGLIKTSMVEECMEGNQSLNEFAERCISQTPLLRAGEPKEISAVVTFVCCPAASFLTGQVIPVDGGFTVCGLVSATSRRTDNLS